MLPKKYRLIKDKDFARVARYGQKAYGSQFNLKWIENHKHYSRWGIIVSLKVDKKAVVRNKIKRRLRAILREEIDSLAPGWDVIIITKDRIKELDYSQLQSIFLEILNKKNLIICQK